MAAHDEENVRPPQRLSTLGVGSEGMLVEFMVHTATTPSCSAGGASTSTTSVHSREDACHRRRHLARRHREPRRAHLPAQLRGRRVVVRDAREPNAGQRVRARSRREQGSHARGARRLLVPRTSRAGIRAAVFSVVVMRARLGCSAFNPKPRTPRRPACFSSCESNRRSIGLSSDSPCSRHGSTPARSSLRRRRCSSGCAHPVRA